MALGFLGGLGTTVGAMQKGYEQAEDREYLQKQREFEQGQRQRKLEEQRREDELRQADAAVSATETFEDPGKQAIYGQESPVIRDDEGNLMPGAQEATPKTVTRKRSWDAIYADYANNRRKVGDVAGAMKFEEQADAASFKQAAQSFLQWSSTTPDTADLHQAAQSAAKMYNSDRLPGKVTGISKNADGSITVNLVNGATGQEIPRTFKSVAELKSGLESYYSPETYNAYLKSRREAAIKAQEKAAEPYTLKPGDERRVGDKVIGRNDTGYILGPNGEAIPLKGGTSGPGSKKGAKTAVDDAMEILKDSMGGKGDGSPEGAARYTRAQSYLDGIFTTNPNVSPRTAAAIAADASADPTKLTLQLDNRTGQVSKVYSNPDFEGGRQFNLGPNSGTVAEMEKVVGKSGMQQAVTGMVAQLASAVPPEQQPAFQQQLIQAATDPKLREQVLAAARENGQDVQAMSRQLDLIKSYAAPAPGPGRTTKTEVGGLNMPKTDPNSPAGRAQARQAQLRAEADAKETKRLEEQKALSAQFRTDAKTLSGVELERKYDRMRGQLPREDQIELRRLAAQAYRTAQ